jgi:DNA (cytosine-5)-methyltransferase 1
MIQAGLIEPTEEKNRIPALVAFAANQRDEVRDLNDVAGALGSQPGMKQQTFVTQLPENVKCLTPWDTQQDRVFTPEGKAPTLAGADGGGGRNPAGLIFSAGVVSKGNGDCFLMPEKHTSLTVGGGQAGQGYPCILTAGFSAGAGQTAGGIGWQEECAPTLKASDGGNMVPSILCLNDQGGGQMHCTEDVTGTLRAQEHGHQPLVMATQQGGAEIGEGVCPTITSAAGTSGNNQPVLFENHGIDSRYTGPHEVAPTMSARYGTGGNNVPLVSQEPEESYCIAGNIVDRKGDNGGNGTGFQSNISYTLSITDRHAVFSRQRSDEFQANDVVATQSARQYKDATDLVCQPTCQQTAEAIGYNDHNEIDNQDMDEDNCVVESCHLIRRLTPLECERLQGFPDGWTDIPGASDSARYKALGNSVAIPCVEFVLWGIAFFYANPKGTGVAKRMSSYLDKPTLKERLKAYQESEDFELDIARLENEYRQNGWNIPSREDLVMEALKEQREWLENLELCETEGHHWQEDNADAENGRSDLHCDRCGFSQRIQW